MVTHTYTEMRRKEKICESALWRGIAAQGTVTHTYTEMRRKEKDFDPSFSIYANRFQNETPPECQGQG